MKIASLTTKQNRAAGALLGAFIGDAMGLGPHWYYDLDEQHRDYGMWITDYTAPKPDRYHGGLKAGDSSQAGLILKLTVESLVSRSGWFRQDFESAILQAVDGGGHNQARAMLTGSLVGAQVGLSGIPTRFLEGLNDCEELISLTVRLAQAKAD